ncbi:myelin and lymphocyte protein-like [Engraulis encrasicolus]|uniref:myelin and lymphocyte protein-like n=1 Tax=Engraulis encrasicolus TaxID=184585 RepID=UPI002FD5EE75
MPDRLIIAEMVCGSVVWMLLVSPGALKAPLLAWALAVSTSCSLLSTLWLLLFCCGCNTSRLWLIADAVYHVLAALAYLSAGVCLAIITNALAAHKHIKWAGHRHGVVAMLYHYFLAATVLAFLTTLLYIIHALYSVKRSQRAPYTAI